MTTDVMIVGAGAAGLMAGALAGELGLRAMVLERKHQPGRKLLMCGNNRCNVTHACSGGELLAAYGEPVADFLRPAVEAFSPADLRAWFEQRGVPMSAHQDGRVFPRSENADHVLHAFTDSLRDLRVPLVLNCPIDGLVRQGDGWLARGERMALEARFVLMATGGVSYPKTGSVGDGQKFARELGHKLEPYRPGLVGFELAERWLTGGGELSFPGTRVEIVAKGNVVGETSGEILTTPWGARGPAMVNASRLVARHGWTGYGLRVDLCPNLPGQDLVAELKRRCGNGRTPLAGVLAGWLLPKPAAGAWVREVLRLDPNRPLAPAESERVVAALKGWELKVQRPRPLKEAMVTVGGVRLEEIDAATMESRVCPGLFFAGEVMDVDGPTGGYNLHAAFATARLAIGAMAARLGRPAEAPRQAPPPPSRKERRPQWPGQRQRRGRR